MSANIERWLRAKIGAILNVPEEEVDIDAPFARFGIDSVEALSITVELEDLLERRLATTLVWDYPTIAKLTRYLEGSATIPPASSHLVPPAPKAGAKISPKLFDISRFDEYRDLRLRIRMAQVPSIGNPYFKLTKGISGDSIVVGDETLINYATYNYLGLSGHPRIVEAVRKAAAEWGTSVSASRTTSGEKPIHRDLERAIAKLLQVDDAVCFVGGHSTNVSFVGKFVGPNDLILHDEFAHDSILQGAKLSGAARAPFRHNDVDAVDAFLKERRGRYRRVLIAVEGVYSTDGDTPPIAALVAVKRKYGALLMVDEAHSIGVIGKSGGGLREHGNIRGTDVDIWMGTLSKALASCGGYIAGTRALVDLVKYTSPGFVYSVGMTPPNTAAALEAIRLMLEEPERVAKVQHNARFFKDECQRLGLDTGLADGSAVVPVQVGDSLQCMRLAQAMFRRGINVTPMVHPAVKNDKARLRFFVSSLHSEEQLRKTAQAVAEELGHIRKMYGGSFERLRDVPPVEPANAAVAREGFEAFTKGDLSILAAQLDENARYFFPGCSSLAGYHNGRDAILDFFTSTFELSDGTLAVDLEAILSDSSHGILIWHNTAYRDDMKLDSRMLEILDVDNGFVRNATFYSSDLPSLDKFMGVKLASPAEPSHHMRTSVDAEGDKAPALRDALHALILDQPQEFERLSKPDAVVTVPAELWADRTPRTVPIVALGERIRQIAAAGCLARTDLVVYGDTRAVARIHVSNATGLVGNIVLVAQLDAEGQIAGGWIATDAPQGFGKLLAAVETKS